MSLRVFAAGANPAVDSRLYRISNNRGKEMVVSGRADFITLSDGRLAVQLRALSKQVETMHVGNTDTKATFLIGRVYNPFLQPPSLNYEIPHAGDCRSICLRRFSMRRDRKGILGRRIIQVSARKIDFSAVPSLKTQLHLLGVKLPPTNIASSLNSVSA